MIQQLHCAPRGRVIVVEQIRALGLLMRTAGVLLLTLYIVLALVAINTAFRVRDANQVVGRFAHLVDYAYTPQMTMLLLSLPLLVPLVVWQDEDPTRRLYHLAMPVSQTPHAAIKTLAGWFWMMAGVTVFLIGLAGVHAFTRWVTGLPQPYHVGFAWWEWIVPYSSVTIAYVFVSAATVGARRPIIWLFGTPAIYAGVIAFLLQGGRDARDVGRALRHAATGYYGAFAAVGGSIDSLTTTFTVSLTRWLGASAIWGALGIALFVFAARRRSAATS